MNKILIDKKDAELLLKVSKARGALAERKRHHFFLQKIPWLFFLLIIGQLIWFGYSYHSKSPSQPAPKGITSVNEPVSSGKADEPVVVKSAPEPTPSTRSMKKNDPISCETDPSSTSRTLQASVSSVSRQTGEPVPEAFPPDNDLKIVRITSCQSVNNRRFIDKTPVFSISRDRTPHVWMEVKPEKIPQTLNHIYYHNGKKYCEVPLSIAYPRTRTWSYITLHNSSFIGDWTVEVVSEDGRILELLEFSVTP